MEKLPVSQAELIAQGKALQKVETAYTTAIVVQKPRDIEKIKDDVLKEANLAGSDFFYGWKVKTKDGPRRIEGPSIGLANCIARNFGNCAVDINLADETATHWVFKAFFIDLETGFNLSRLYRQRQRLPFSMDDGERALDISFQIGQSKAERNVVTNAMPGWLIDRAIQIAKEAERSRLLAKEDIETARAKALKHFMDKGVPQEKIEKVIGRKWDQWTIDDLVELRGMATALKENRVTLDELFPDDDEGSTVEKDLKDLAEFEEAEAAGNLIKGTGKDPAPESDIEKNRKEYKTLRKGTEGKSGLKYWLNQNLERVRAWPRQNRDEIIEKYKKFYISICPLEKPPEEKTKAPEDPGTGNGNNGSAFRPCPRDGKRLPTAKLDVLCKECNDRFDCIDPIHCPEANKRLTVGVCKWECKDRERCQDYQAYLFEKQDDDND